MRRRFRFSNYQSSTKVRPFTCSVPLALKPGWNHIQLNLANFTMRAYGTNYLETQRVQVHANCRIRRIYFSDRLYSEEELPREYRVYLNLQSTKPPAVERRSLVTKKPSVPDIRQPSSIVRAEALVERTSYNSISDKHVLLKSTLDESIMEEGVTGPTTPTSTEQVELTGPPKSERTASIASKQQLELPGPSTSERTSSIASKQNIERLRSSTSERTGSIASKHQTEQPGLFTIERTASIASEQQIELPYTSTSERIASTASSQQVQDKLSKRSVINNQADLAEMIEPLFDEEMDAPIMHQVPEDIEQEIKEDEEDVFLDTLTTIVAPNGAGGVSTPALGSAEQGLADEEGI